jgi:lipopolysaccharide export system permease protein
MSKIWQRYFIRELLKVFLMLLFCFYALYVLIDYSSRPGTFRALGLSSWQLTLYYLYTFVMRADILIPFALLIATIKTVLAANMHRELVALLASGIRLKQILRPFLYTGLAFTALVYLNTEWIVPQARIGLQKMEELRFLSIDRGLSSRVHSLVLKDRSILIYQSFDAPQETFFDLFWVRTADDIYRIKFLTLKHVPEGSLVDHLSRNSNGQLVQVSFSDHMLFPQIEFSDENITETLRPASDLSLSQLWGQLDLNKSDKIKSDKKAKIETALYHKLVMPWLCLLAVLAPLPYCVQFSRNPPQFFIYVLGMFGLVTLYLLMSALATISQNQVADPFWVLLFPMVLIGCGCSWKYALMR